MQQASYMSWHFSALISNVFVKEKENTTLSNYGIDERL
jgi:hypothetical protein